MCDIWAIYMGREGERQRLLIQYKRMWRKNITIHPSPTNVTKQSESANPWVITNSHHCYKKIYIYIYIFFLIPKTTMLYRLHANVWTLHDSLKCKNLTHCNIFLLKLFTIQTSTGNNNNKKDRTSILALKKTIMRVQNKCIKSLPLKITITRNQSQEYRTHPNHTVVKLPVPYLILTGKIRLQYIILYNYYNVTCKSFKHLPKPVI